MSYFSHNIHPSKEDSCILSRLNFLDRVSHLVPRSNAFTAFKCLAYNNSKMYLMNEETFFHLDCGWHGL